MSGDSKSKMVSSAAALIGSRGVNATSFSDVLNDSGAPRGSIYHHFPDGKRQLAEAAVRWTSGRVISFQQAGGAMTAPQVLERFIGIWRNVVLNSDGTAGCVVAGVAVDTAAENDPPLIELVRETFRAWTGLVADQLEAAGISTGRARSIAMTTVAGMEGALILCRAEGNSAPLETVARSLIGLLDQPTGTE